jgi:hypothetical protein
VADQKLVVVTEFPLAFAGDVVTYDWRPDGDTLVLKLTGAPPDEILPVICCAHPLTRP